MYSRREQTENKSIILSYSICSVTLLSSLGLGIEVTLTYPVALFNVTTTPTDIVKINIYKALDKEAGVGSDQRLSASGINGTNTNTSNLSQHDAAVSFVFRRCTSALRITFPRSPATSTLPPIRQQFPQI